MTKKFFIAAFVALAFAGCKNEKKEDKVADQPSAQAENNFFQVTLGVVAKKDDHFHVYYTEDNSITFTEDKSVWADVKGSDSEQKLVFKLPEDAVPTQLRIDFGWTKDQGDVKINNMEMSYYGKVFTIAGPDFFKYFMPNESNTIANEQAQTVKSLTNDGKIGPSVYPKETLAKELVTLTSGK